MQVIITGMASNGTTPPTTLNPGGAKTLVVEGNLGGGTLTFNVTYFGITQNPVNGTDGSALSMTAAGVYDLFWLGGGMQISATLSGATTPNLSIAIG